MKREATFDSSFWVHAVYLNLVDFLLEDYELSCTPAVEAELGQTNLTGLKLKALLVNGRIKSDAAESEKIKLYGDGERAAINLALEKKMLILIDDWKPYQAAVELGAEAVNSLICLVGLYDQDRILAERVLDAMAKMTRRGTIKAEWLLEALKVVAFIREKRFMKGERNEKS